ncbi:hypothetical protein J7E50_10685 [Pedobacter sp. ISL-68]|uniref:hypothetical protein n=1 Tax=unclassified Pedobacter TaxID=2628915 RepID=UPI001BEBBE56|nr:MULTISPECIES: hypothetical protein [unclassified Pedobacter]MBT2561296.1 hypothetical protein [Pedobacter sp. ISL-64]MBT2590686.1 hypothetical protein [Pedobacter sp. ISL-68]
MKKIILLILALAIVPATKAQTFDEWFRQKSTQRKYLLEQIAALRVYGSYVQKGYKIAQKGLNTIGQIKDGDINLHRIYFNSLKDINPSVRNYKRTGDIITIQNDIRRETENSRKVVSKTEVLSNEEKNYLNGVYAKLERDCLLTLDELEAVITSGKREMKDDERIERIDKLFAQSQNQYRFIKDFSSGISVLINEKTAEAKEIELQKKLYQIN